MTLVLEEIKSREVLKEIIAEVLQERSDLLYDVFAEVIEDFALAEAVREGMSSEIVSRDAVFRRYFP